MLNNLANFSIMFFLSLDFMWVFIEITFHPQFVNCREYTPVLTKLALCAVVSAVCFNLPLSYPLFVCLFLTSFSPPLLLLHWLSSLSSTLFFASGSLLTRTSASVLLNQGRGPPLCPPPCQPPPTLRQRLLVSLCSFLSDSIPSSDPSTPSSSFTFWKHGFTKVNWPLHSLITYISFKISFKKYPFLLHI